MPFENLGDRLRNAFKDLRGKGKLSPDDIDNALREVRKSLLEADVNFKVAKQFIANVREKALGEEVFGSLKPDQTVIKIVRDELTELLGGTSSKITISSTGLTVLMLVGLQGAGKTTTVGKLALRLKKQGKNPMLVACDVYRPAAIKQLQILGEQVKVPVFTIEGSNSPVEIARNALDEARKLGRDVVILDTAGRLTIDEELMEEIRLIKSNVHPHEILLVLDSMTGQDAVNTAKAFNDVFGVDELFFEKEIKITQKVKLTDPNVKHIKGNIFCQACIDVCINLKEDFVFSLDGSAAQVEQKQVDARSEDMAKQLEIPLKNKELIGETQKESNWMVFILGFIGGFIALLTPCVFPMIPLTVSFFTKQSKTRKKGIFNAFLYGFFILLIYVLLSIPFHFLDNIDPEILNNISTNVWLNVVFFVIFVIFAFSFFGFYEITLPSSWGNKMDNASNVGGMIGIFFMALTLAIVSFSCTGPILGSLLAGSLSSGGAIQLTLGMAGFGPYLLCSLPCFRLGSTLYLSQEGG